MSLGHRLRRLARRLARGRTGERPGETIRRRLAQNPLDAAAHRELALLFAGDGSLRGRLRAHAELRTAQALASDPAAPPIPGPLPPETGGPDSSLRLQELDHNQSYRFRTLAGAVRRVAGVARPRVLDVGGGDGGLAWFLPEAEYVLAEPAVNGIDGAALPFPAASFDVVCACHVLEHVAPDRRATFLDNLLAVSRRHVLLLNPFQVAHSLYPRRLELILEITGAQWAREHLECGLPTLEEIQAYAASRSIRCRIEPNGCLMTSLSMVFVEHYATLAGRAAELDRINTLFNSLDVERSTHPELPVAHLVHLEL